MLAMIYQTLPLTGIVGVKTLHLFMRSFAGSANNLVVATCLYYNFFVVLTDLTTAKCNSMQIF